jgi:hypothetical protein
MARGRPSSPSACPRWPARGPGLRQAPVGRVMSRHRRRADRGTCEGLPGRGRGLVGVVAGLGAGRFGSRVPRRGAGGRRSARRAGARRRTRAGTATGSGGPPMGRPGGSGGWSPPDPRSGHASSYPSSPESARSSSPPPAARAMRCSIAKRTTSSVSVLIGSSCRVAGGDDSADVLHRLDGSHSGDDVEVVRWWGRGGEPLQGVALPRRRSQE